MLRTLTAVTALTIAATPVVAQEKTFHENILQNNAMYYKIAQMCDWGFHPEYFMAMAPGTYHNALQAIDVVRASDVGREGRDLADQLADGLGGYELGLCFNDPQAVNDAFQTEVFR